ncbi:hypothetical protein B4U80_08125 [Leptotrombidium deliense]|uniref:UBL3-like ubiquitin domain-containing protein n=1 Tax=Leptotrombidium deliense TaxID=299467 RepID=A0A443S1W4_9ACAR|nr:hypothetical protein B4U80_08125 [Leptotrombidium deliense]
MITQQINLRLILVSGKSKDFLFSPSDSAADIAQHVFDHWPQDWKLTIEGDKYSNFLAAVDKLS